jgi:hypothetical protein
LIDPRIKLTIFHDDNAVFADYSEQSCDYTRDTVSITALNKDDDYLYFGYYKPINAVYVELATANTNANTLAFEYYDGSAWSSLTVRDESKGFTRSGFILWDRQDDHTETEINSTTLYWVRCRPSVTHSATSIQGINLVFCDDISLKEEFADISNSDLLASGQTSHILAHVAARNEILKILRNRGYIKYNEDTGFENITQWDLLDIHEIREAAKFKALANIFFELSESTEDKWFMKYELYDKKFKAEMNSQTLSVDEDDDGVMDEGEKKQKVRITRLKY